MHYVLQKKTNNVFLTLIILSLNTVITDLLTRKRNWLGMKKSMRKEWEWSTFMTYLQTNQKITLSFCSKALLIFTFNTSSVSLNIVLLSECPIKTYWQPIFLIISADISPVKAPFLN